jgi:RHS repeat-associated protein
VEYVYDGWQVIEERNASNSLMRRIVMGLKIDEPLQLENISFWPNAGTYHYQRSTLGNVVALTNSSGAVVERYTYDSYGSPRFENASNVDQSLTESAYGNPYLFHGRRHEPGLYAMYEYRTRMYSPEMGRFVQRDSIGVWGDPGQFGNPFSFVGDAPTNATDPFGLEVVIWTRPVDTSAGSGSWAPLPHKSIQISLAGSADYTFGGQPSNQAGGIFPGGDGNLRIKLDDPKDKGTGTDEKKIPAARGTVLPPPFPEVSQVEWDNIVLQEALKLADEVNKAPQGPNGKSPQQPPASPPPAPERGDTGGAPPARYPFSRSPFGYNCWWTVDQIRHRSFDEARRRYPKSYERWLDRQVNKMYDSWGGRLE